METTHTIFLEATCCSHIGLAFKANIGSFKVSKQDRCFRICFGTDAKGLAILQLPNFSKTITVPLRSSPPEFDWQLLEVARNGLRQLRATCLGSYSALVHVGSGGDVACSDLAGRVKIKLLDGRTTTKVVPASQVESIDGKFWIPRWLALKKANNQELAGPFRLPDTIEAGLCGLEKELEVQAKLLAETAGAFLEKWIEAAPARAVLEEQRLQERQAASARERALAEEASRLSMAKKLAQKHKALERIKALPVYAENVKVQGKDWSRENGNFESFEWEFESATVHVSGTRAYIFLPGQAEPEFWKPLNSITIVGSLC